MNEFVPVAWDGDGVRYLDQRLLPHEVRYERACTVAEIEGAIKSLAIRGAPCIGVSPRTTAPSATSPSKRSVSITFRHASGSSKQPATSKRLT